MPSVNHHESERGTQVTGTQEVTKGNRISSVNSIRFSCPVPIVVVAHSPTPSNVRIAASSNGEGKKALAASPNPVDTIFYEGLLDIDPRRIETSKSLNDMNLLTNLIYYGYVENNEEIGPKVKLFVLAWASTYLPNGNPINENKFITKFGRKTKFNPMVVLE